MPLLRRGAVRGRGRGGGEGAGGRRPTPAPREERALVVVGLRGRGRGRAGGGAGPLRLRGRASGRAAAGSTCTARPRPRRRAAARDAPAGARAHGVRAGRGRGARGGRARARPAAATFDGAVLDLRTAGGGVRVWPRATCCWWCKGPIVREHTPARRPAEVVRTATLEPGFRFHLHRPRRRAPAVELDPAAFELGAARGGDSIAARDRGLDGAPRRVRPRGRRLPPRPPGAGPGGARRLRRWRGVDETLRRAAGREAERPRQPRPVPPYSAWRGAVERLLAPVTALRRRVLRFARVEAHRPDPLPQRAGDAARRRCARSRARSPASTWSRC